MRKLLYMSGTVLGLALISPAALAATRDEVQTLLFGPVQISIFLVFVVFVAVAVYFTKFPADKRQTPLKRIFEGGKAIHSIAPDTPVTECVRLMAANKVGALVVLDGGRLIGIFTERDALNKVLAGGLDPRNTKVSEVMTKDPWCVRSTTTVAEAMKMVTTRRFRHLPVVDDGKVLAVVSSGDLTHWLTEDQTGEVQELVDLANKSSSHKL